MRVRSKRLLICIVSFCFGFEGGMLDMVVLVPNHCLPVYFIVTINDFFLETATTIFISSMLSLFPRNQTIQNLFTVKTRENTT